MIDPAVARAAYEAEDAAGFARAIAPLQTNLTYAKLRSLAPSPTELEMICALLPALNDALDADNTDGDFGFIVRHNSSGSNGTLSTEGSGKIRFEIMSGTRKTTLNMQIQRRVLPVVDAALLAAVFEDPDDLDARSVYADALLAAGDPRGSLARAQCELARQPRDPEAQAHARAEWNRRGGLVGHEACGGTFTMRAGFFETLTANPHQLERAIDTGLFSRHPIRALTISVINGTAFQQADKLARRLPQRLQELRVVAGVSAPVTHAIDRSPLLLRPGTLGLERIVATGAQWRAALASMVAEGLELVLAAPVPPQLIEALSRRAFLETLSITYAEGENNWADLGALKRLTSLSLTGFPVELLRTLLPVMFASGRLESFASNDFYGDALADLVLAQPHSTRLRSLAVNHSPDRLVRTLTTLPKLRVVAARLDAMAFENSRFHPLELAMMLTHSKVEVRCANPVPELAKFCR